MIETFFNGLWAERYFLAGFVAALLSAAAFWPYIRDTLTGQTQPDRACWLIWAVLASISGASNLYEGAGPSLIFVGAQVLGTVIVFALSIPLGSGRFLCRVNGPVLLLAGAGLVSWAMMDTAAYALAISIGVSALGGVTTLRKAFLNPQSETLCAWVVLLIAALLGVYSMGSTEVLLLAYPLYLLVLYAGIVVALTAGRIARAQEAEEHARHIRRLRVPPVTIAPTPAFQSVRMA